VGEFLGCNDSEIPRGCLQHGYLGGGELQRIHHHQYVDVSDVHLVSIVMVFSGAQLVAIQTMWVAGCTSLGLSMCNYSCARGCHEGMVEIIGPIGLGIRFHIGAGA
jgi:hypothetical protein